MKATYIKIAGVCEIKNNDGIFSGWTDINIIIIGSPNPSVILYKV